MRDLGKWPCLVVAGDPVTRQQANSILIRTMSWRMMSCNDRDWLAEVRSIMAEFGMPAEPRSVDFPNHDSYLHVLFRDWWPRFDEFCDRYGFLQWLDLDKLANDRITSSYLGWCSWSGVIGCVRNVGKWPSDEEMLEKWRTIAAAFPYLRLDAEMISEDGDRTGGVRYAVANGRAAMRYIADEPALEPPAEWVGSDERTDRMYERGVSPERLREAFRDALS